MQAPTSLTEYIERTTVECLNEDPDHNVKCVLTSDYDSYLASCPGEDVQMLLKFGFSNPVKINSIVIRGMKDGFQSGTYPRKLRIFINNISMGFQEAEIDPCTQELLLEERHALGEPIHLRHVKFQNVNCIILFIEENFGNSDSTMISHLEFFGNTIATSSVCLRNIYHL
ncbi:bifunctional PITH domain/PITH domain superfamily/Galactose-binding-like domain superfamily/PITH domain-containing protein 1-like [Babesia duncani]|uniref:Bifunctional PITH domain/PITH domain superfamily/Galactose-binding-like domain superfamily/PITH domain-containing protein 1-like n=1 Tax=Babesia duncani TaxID=323732 RepID=A0AAD9PM71_9APIC|nr:bifunctional PITH domain/PITH domain superfamily/Galactose-binding-like domain superfamily/PITH domain-containing protein 1-like [Babesia duncani]